MAKLSKTFGFIGCGNLAQAVISGAIAEKTVRPAQIFISDRSLVKAKKFARKTKIKIVQANTQLVQKTRIIFLAVKPQDALDVLKLIAPLITGEHIIVSLAAGVEAKLIQKYLPQAGGVVRVMANTPAQIRLGVYGIYFLKSNKQVQKLLTQLFSSIGIVVPLKNDDQVDVITSGSASGVGFIFEFMNTFEKWFVKKGLSAKTARQISVAAFLGSATLAKLQESQALEKLRQKVTSKKGTTLAGLRSMKSNGLQKSIAAGLESAKSRAKEISKSLRKASK